ncbi:MAG: tetratricopeptide repeat protein [bacterium]
MLRTRDYLWLGFILLLMTGCAGGWREIREDYVIENNYGVRCIRLGLWNDALIWLEKARDKKPEKASIHNNLGVVYEYFGQLEEAGRAYEKAVELSGGKKVYRENLQAFIEDRGQKTEAEDSR